MSNFVETWKGIAFAVGRSERWCRYMARRGEDPLPVYKIGGIVRLNTDELELWLIRQRERTVSRATSEAPVASQPAGPAELGGDYLKLIA